MVKRTTIDKDLNDIRYLLVRSRLKYGSIAEAIALALQVDSSLVRKTTPARQVGNIVNDKAG